MKPLFSILIPTYNRAQHARQAVQSVLAQTWTGSEIFVIDDGSTDGTREALAPYAPAIRYLRQANRGPEVARNNAASLAQGQYLVFLDSDDVLLPGALQAYAGVIQSCDSPPLIIGSMCYFDGEPAPRGAAQNGSTIRALKFRDYLSKDVPVALSSSRIVIRKSLFDRLGGLRQTTPTTFHLDDFNLILKAGVEGPCIVLVEPATVAYRKHETNSIRDPRAMVNGILSLIGSEKKGEYAGGRARRQDRYACIGGIAQYWALKSVHAGKPGQALRLLFHGAPMLAAAAGRKLRLAFSRKTPALEISSEAKPASEGQVSDSPVDPLHHVSSL